MSTYLHGKCIEFTFTAKPKKSMKYIKILQFINDHEFCSKDDIFGTYFNMQKDPGYHKYHGASVMNALEKNGFVYSIRNYKKEHGKKYYAITEAGINKINNAI